MDQELESGSVGPFWLRVLPHADRVVILCGLDRPWGIHFQGGSLTWLMVAA